MLVAAAAVMTSYVISVAQSSHDCGVDEFYDRTIEECRSCNIICDPDYGTLQECIDKCPGTMPTLN